MAPSYSRRLRWAAALAVVPAWAVGPAPAASAHVGLVASSTDPGSTAVVRLTVEHGCAGSPTTALAVRMPAGAEVVSVPTDALWESAVPEEPDAPVTFTAASPVPDGREAAVQVEVRLPDTPGATLAFPTVQTCAQGELAWLEVASSAAEAAELEQPAPVLVLGGTPVQAVAVADSEEGVPAIALGVVGLGLAGAAVAGGVAARRRRLP